MESTCLHAFQSHFLLCLLNEVSHEDANEPNQHHENE